MNSGSVPVNTSRTVADVIARAHDESLERVLLANQFHQLTSGSYLASLHLDADIGEEPRAAMPDLSEHDVHELARVLPTLRGLRTLTLSCNSLGDEGAREICAALAGHPSLLRLGLSFNAIGDAGAEHLAKLMRCNGCLTSLNLFGNHFSDAGALVLEGALGESLSLTEVNLASSKFCKDDEAVATRLRALARTPVLERANVHDQWELDVKKASLVLDAASVARMMRKAEAERQAQAAERATQAAAALEDAADDSDSEHGESGGGEDGVTKA